MIRWPWVSRALLEAVAAANRRADEAQEATVGALSNHLKAMKEIKESTQLLSSLLREERERSAVRYDELLARYHMLKLQGFSEPTQPVARPVVPPDPIKRAIAQRAGTNRSLRENMERQVAQDRLMGKSDEEILSAIIAGVSGEDLILSEAGLMST